MCEVVLVEGSKESPRPVVVIHRCPYCHGDLSVADDEWVACRGCLARHHSTCWGEAGRCSTCGDPRTLSSIHVRTAPRGRRRHPLLTALSLPARALARLARGANAWPRLTGVIIIVALLAALAGSRDRVITHTRTEYVYVDRPAPVVVEQRGALAKANDLVARGEFTQARRTLERAIAAGEGPSQALNDALGWASLCDGLPEDAARAYATSRGSRTYDRWGEVLSLAALGDRAAALERLGPELNVGSPVYRDLWRALLTGDASGLEAQATEATWHGALARWGMGTIGDAELLSLAEGSNLSNLTPDQRLCEAHHYLALRADLRGDRATALERYALAQRTGVFNYIEYAFSAARLRALQGGGATLDALSPR
jgi:hypothetical protein